MTPIHRPRRLVAAALTATVALGLAACATQYPNSTFSHHTEFNREIDHLWNLLLGWGTAVFIFVEALLVFTIVRFRRREGTSQPRHVHGNTTLEIAWTVLPAVILVVIAVPTVRTIFRTEAKAEPGALQVEVIGHQWWWEFRYPQLGVTTANELYLPQGRTVNFALRTADVLHSFWIPRLGGKRDLITNHTNYLWFTADSVRDSTVWNGFCAEYCGSSHANMHFRVFTVAPADFDSWAAHQKLPAAFAAGGQLAAAPKAGKPELTFAGQVAADVPRAAPAAGFIAFPAERMPDYAIPKTPLPPGLDVSAALPGDAGRGQKTYSGAACIGCHTIAGNPASVGVLGPNLTHIGLRTTIGAGLYPNDTPHLVRWIKNAPLMKPGSLMPTLGKGQLDPRTGKTALTGLYTDQEIADIAAYLQALK